ncbi:hypothetical protein BX616_010259 [Lobosporangium transversale]|uniref:Uncharacterized protein n=1 Tax=Lobosporangium transversale TaxID=64571 RepID=A0A1Y2GQY0_9FUNG|nr:hypothetical protein BCR41DRAFT_42600 [Lobosporangium transversale]KAF9912741.1 hypothetical protein BX616_010259 [Lobosporangium transversale]ORZ19264.1 hypothetical protein BCR41DRAFT_42600 [Lobosporangium transversale]|eukprot:XP_021882432.1 hypothetical protein BCR41DRAFT_42600 [Lobosporangium transversale]
MANARTFVPTIEDIGLLSDIKMDTIADTSSELVIYTARFKDAYNNLSHQLEVLHKKSRVLKKKKNQCIEKLFDERCRIFSEQLQAHYRSVGESLVGADADGLDSALIMGVVEDGTLTSNGSHQTILNNSGLRMALQRQHVEGNLLEPYSYSSEGSSTLGLDSQEILAESEELPSYFQHEYEASAHQHQQQQQQQQQQQHRHTHSRNHSQSHGNGHRRNFSLGSPAHSSSASSSLSLHSPLPIHATVLTTDSPPDYVREEPAATIATVSGHNHSTLASIAVQEDEADAQFQAYHSRYDSRQRQGSDPRTRPHITTMATIATANGGGSGNGSGAMDMPPEYEETRYHTAVNPA